MRIKRILRNYLVNKVPLFNGCETCEDRIPSLNERICDKFNVNFPIDIVYTWVDGSDKDHMIKRSLFLGNKKHHKDGISNARFRDNDELRYSLRSIDKYAPWINHIYIVTDNQIPKWLNRYNKKISIIDHREIIPERYLPTFNSHVIEFYLHTIDGLSEHFIYFNDDFFLTSITNPEYFFTSNGIPIITVDWRKSRLEGYYARKTPHAHSYFNVLKILHEKEQLEKLGKFSFFITQHGPYAQSKQNANDAYVFFEKNIGKISKNKFRTNEEIAFYSHAIPLYAAYNKKAILCDEKYFYINIAKVDRNTYYKYLVKNKDNCSLPTYISVNDVDNSNFLHHEDMQKFMHEYYTTRSSFEI